MAWHIARSFNGSCSTACWCNHPDPEGIHIALSARDYQWAWKPDSKQEVPKHGE